MQEFTVAAYFNKGRRVAIYIDASPYGLGAWLEVDGHPTAYTSDIVQPSVCPTLGIDNTGSAAQQALEALALLMAVRLWLPDFKTERVCVLVRGDNIASLQMAAKMQPKSKALGIVARELALDLSEASYAIDLVQHVAGVTNGVADVLSRRYQVGKHFVLPTLLQNASETLPPCRDDSWWRTKPVRYTRMEKMDGASSMVE